MPGSCSTSFKCHGSPRRDEAATAIADAAHPCAERTLRSKCDAGAVHGDILQRPAFDRARKRNADCLFDLHVGPPVLQLCNGTPISARTRGRATMAQRLSPMKDKRKITSRHGVDSRPLSEQLRDAWRVAAGVLRFTPRRLAGAELSATAKR